MSLVKLSDGSELSFHLYGDDGELNSYYIIVAPYKLTENLLSTYFKDTEICLEKPILDSEYGTGLSGYTLYYLRSNFRDSLVWKEPLYKILDLEEIFNNVLIIERNNVCCVRDDYNETDKPWNYFGIYGLNNGLKFGFEDDEGKYCDIHWEVFINACVHVSKDSSFICKAALDDVVKWFKLSSGYNEKLTIDILNTIDKACDEHRDIFTI